MSKLFLPDHQPNTRIVYMRPARPHVVRFLVPLVLIAMIGIAVFFEYGPHEMPAAENKPLSGAERLPVVVRRVSDYISPSSTDVNDVAVHAVAGPGDDASDIQRSRADRFYEDARIARLCAAWWAGQEQLAAIREKGEVRPPTGSESDAEVESQAQGNQTGASAMCPSLGTPDLAQADLQMKEAARLGSPEGRYEVLAEKLRQLRAENLASPMSPSEPPALPSQDILNLRSELSELANAGNTPAQFLMASTLREGTLGQTNPQLATAWEMVAIHAPGPVFDVQTLVQYGPFASSTAREQVALAAAAAEIFKNIRR